MNISRAALWFYSKLFLLTGCIFLLASFSVQAQDFDFGQLGVNVTLVGVVITLVQTIKATIAKNAPGWVFMVVTMVLCGVIGYLTAPEGTGAEDMVKLVFAYLTASAWLYNIAKRTPGVKNLFKDGKELKAGSVNN